MAEQLERCIGKQAIQPDGRDDFVKPRYAAVIRAYECTPLLAEVTAALKGQTAAPEELIIVDSSKDPAVAREFAALGATVVPYTHEDFNYSRAINIGVAENRHPLTLVISSHIMLHAENLIEAGWSAAQARGLEIVYWTSRVGCPPPPEYQVVMDERKFTGRNGLSNSMALLPTQLIHDRPFREEVFSAEDQEWTRYYLKSRKRPMLRIETVGMGYLNPNHNAEGWNETKLLNEELAIGHFVNRRLIMPDRIFIRFLRGILATIRRRPERAQVHFGFAKAMLMANFLPPKSQSRYFK